MFDDMLDELYRMTYLVIDFRGGYHPKSIDTARCKSSTG